MFLKLILVAAADTKFQLDSKKRGAEEVYSVSTS